jgi:hypothetical protein
MEAPVPQKAALDNFNVLAQPDGSSCGITTISMLKAFLTGQSVGLTALIEKYLLTGGITAAQFTDLLSLELPDYEVGYRSNLSTAQLIVEIHGQLIKGVPVPVFFGAPDMYNKPWYNFHASVVTAIDLDAQTVGVANAYGYAETLPLDEFLDRMRYGDPSRYPVEQRTALELGLVDVNVMCVVERRKGDTGA